MNLSQSLTPILVVAGPTAAGKSNLSLAIAREFDGEIVNADSVQIYRHFDIGSAKLPAEQREGIPHHLLDIVEPDAVFTAGDYARSARAVLGDTAARGKVPVVTGGTGFYIRALFDGLFEGPARDSELRTRLARREGRQPGSLHRWLTRFDPAAAARIHPHDVNKTVRALEILLLARRPVSQLHAEGRDRLEGCRRLLFVLDPPREALYERIDARSRALFHAGLVDEVRTILSRGYRRDAKPFESLGYVQALGVVDGRLTIEEAIAETAMMTRRYAKRQRTWFRKEPDAIWIADFGENAIRPIVDRIRHWLA
ncbi:MAG: tRNA (adenosine(37)-N6)-dimethylallyltransferase MiaA [Bryobacteraceae bacterium]